jgi:pyruvate ferredoxin oxidoreductase gamma subunit
MGEFVADFHPERVRTMPATQIAREHLGRPLPNSVLLGGFAGLCDVVSLESVNEALRDRFPGKLGDMNTAAATAARDFVRDSLDGSVSVRPVAGEAARA